MTSSRLAQHPAAKDWIARERMRVLVLGADGQVGHESVAVMRLFAEVVPAYERDLDITDADALARTLEQTKPDVVINAAAYNDVDGAESDEERAISVNRGAVAVLGELSRTLRFGIVHFSSDFVFDGLKGARYVEDDQPHPLSAYGRSKLAGERALLELDAPALIFRTAWVYSTRCKSFVSTMLQLARTQDQLRVVADQRGNPTFCRDLAVAVALVLRDMAPAPVERMHDSRGLYHLAGSGACSRYELAVSALELDPLRSEHNVRSVVPISTDELALAARRPPDVDLDCTKALTTFGISLPPWRVSLARALER